MHDRLQSQHLTIGEITRNLSPEKRISRPAPEKWNIHDNMAHLARYQIIFIDRIQTILLEDNPVFDRYTAEKDPGFTLFRNLFYPELLSSLEVQRKKIIELIQSLDKSKLSRKGAHKKYGNLDIIQWTEFFLLHEAHHIFTIFQLAHDTGL